MDWSNIEVKDYWHVYSDGKRADIPFLTVEDKVFARNSVAICSYWCDVTILCVTINETHLHTFIKAKESDARRFTDLLRLRLISYYKKGGHPEKIGNGLFVECDSVEDVDQIKRTIMYVFRNCLDFFDMLPGEYPWGSGNIYFARSETERGTPLSHYSYREQQRILHTNTKLPQDWKIDDNHSIVPASFVDYKHVEGFFGSVRAFIAFLYVRKSDEGAMKASSKNRELEERRLEDLRAKGNTIAKEICGQQLQMTSIDIRLQVARKMIRDRIAFKSESLEKALYLKAGDLDFI